MIKTSTPELKITGPKNLQSDENQHNAAYSPSVESIRSILNFSRNLEVKKSRLVNYIEILKS